MAASLVILAAAWLPISFDYRPNALGIVSVTTLRSYPTQQEVFWWVFAAGVGAGGVVVLARWLQPLSAGGRAHPGLEGLGAASLASVLWLPTPVGAAAALVCIGSALFLAARAPRSGCAPAAKRDAAGPPLSGRFQRLHWLGLAIVASFVTSDVVQPAGFWGGVGAWLHQTPDLSLAGDHWYFLGEWGEHLAWADRIRAGEIQGRDFFSLYGPLYELSLAATFALLGRSLASYTLWSGTLAFAGGLGWLALASRLVQRPAVLWLFPLLVPFVSVRIGLPLCALAALVQWRQSGRGEWCAASGALAALALLVSQEFGAVALGVGLLGVTLVWERKAFVHYLGGALAVLLPVLAGFAAVGGLAPMLRDLVAYPSYVAAGYANLPAVPLVARLPLDALPGAARWELVLRLTYGLPAIALAGVLLCLPVARSWAREPGRALAELRTLLLGSPRTFGVVALSLFSLLAFRSALGRTDLGHLLVLVAPAALLILVAADGIWGTWRRDGDGLRAAWHTVLLAVVVSQTALPLAAQPSATAARARAAIRSLAAPRPAPPEPRLAWLSAWLAENSAADDPILMLPNGAGHYFLSERRDPTRFVLPAMIVTDAHRREVLEDLRASPPRYVVWDERGKRIDGLSDEVVLGTETLTWIRESYRPQVRHLDYEILVRNGNGGGEP